MADKDITDVENNIHELLKEAGFRPGDVVAHGKVEIITEEPTLSQMLAKIDNDEIREDVFLAAVVNELASKADRLRHRATLMRQRADEFDEYADDIENNRIESVKEYVFTLMQHIHEIEAVLRKHAHVEPSKVKP